MAMGLESIKQNDDSDGLKPLNAERLRTDIGKNDRASGSSDFDFFFNVGRFFRTNLLGFEGDWEIVGIPYLKKDVVYVPSQREFKGEIQKKDFSLVELGVVMDRKTMEYSGVLTVQKVKRRGSRAV